MSLKFISAKMKVYVYCYKSHPFRRIEIAPKVSFKCFYYFDVILTFRYHLRLDYISIEASIATAFNFATYTEVIMRKVDPVSVALDSLEITFKDQYLGRSEMWRLKTFLVNMSPRIFNILNQIKH